MKLHIAILASAIAPLINCEVHDRPPLELAPIPTDTYVAPVGTNVTTLLGFIKSRDDLSMLADLLTELEGQARDKSSNKY